MSIAGVIYIFMMITGKNVSFTNVPRQVELSSMRTHVQAFQPKPKPEKRQRSLHRNQTICCRMRG